MKQAQQASVFPKETECESLKAGFRAIRLDGQISVLKSVRRQLVDSPYFKRDKDGLDNCDELLFFIDKAIIERDAELISMAGGEL